MIGSTDKNEKDLCWVAISLDISGGHNCTPSDTVENMKLLVCHAATSMEYDFVMSLCSQTTVVRM